MNTKKVVAQLRTGDAEELGQRRKIILLSAIGLVDFSIISLYQTGVIKKLPDLPFKVFDSNAVNASESAYPLGIPDGTLGAVPYVLNMILAAAGGTKKSGRKDVFDYLLGGVIVANAAGAANYLVDMTFKQKKACIYCVVGAAINFASVAVMAPIIKKRLKSLF